MPTAKNDSGKSPAMTSKPRIATVSRETKETKITVTINLDGSGNYDIDTGIGFFDHMLEGFARHGFFDLKVKAKGDLQVDPHHTVEDCGIVLGETIAKALGDKEGISRYGYFLLPMDDALSLCAIDLCGRFYLDFDCKMETPRVGAFETQLAREFFYALASNARMNLHIQMLRGINDHHKIEAMFKAFAKALDMATRQDPRVVGVLSTKESL